MSDDLFGIMARESNLQIFQEPLGDDDVFKLISERNKLFVNLQNEVEILKENFEHTLQPFWQEIKNEMFDLKNQIKDKDEKIKQLEVDYQKQTRNVEDVRNELKMTKEAHENAWHNQSVCLNRLSLTFGSLLWKASKESNVIQCFTTGNKILDLLEIICDSLRIFFSVYADEFPDSKSEEKKFITSFVGIVSNIAATPDGRRLLVNSEEGQRLVKVLLENLSRIPQDEIPLQRVVLTTLYNISINTVGLSVIENEFSLVERVVNNIISNNEQKQISLKLLESITYETKNQQLIEFLSIFIPFEKLKEKNDSTSLKLSELMINIGKNSEYEEIIID